MKRFYKDLKPLLLIASAAWVFGFMGMLGANQAAKLVGVSIAIAYEEGPEKASANEGKSDE
ncbi:hypothetical protein EZI54_03875 [Marinobacter halodurans]|uniref:TMhelix containing protein n=1 Tax=Marinobacter halodurans TaxID=2528979 RepID=A0ABY1ZP56_9GAMM|nr:hypothetical protein [Marinobacter halodurans]TBW58531.1 hypothetical protein EZI54_03875 [Marinobacter halodurans]